MSMLREYRKELSALRQARKKAVAAAAKAGRVTTSDLRKLQREFDKARRQLERAQVDTARAATREVQTIDRRIQILEGRLS